MFTALALLLAFVPQTPLTGLKPDESVREIAPFAAALDPDAVFGRVLDAATSAPLAGVLIECWTENWDAPAKLIDRALSARDGTYSLRRRRDGREGEKVRLRAPGFRSTTRGSGDVFDDILLVRGPAPASLTVIDLDGRPIAGARFTTRQTCAHEPPAIDVTSDALGRFDLAELPPLEDEPEGQIDAHGYEALRSIQADDLLELGNWKPEQYLGRKRPLRLRVLEHDGRPAARRRVVLGGAPEWQAAVTDEQGRVVFDSLFAEPQVLLQMEVDGKFEPLVECCAWRDTELVVRRGGDARERTPSFGDTVLTVTGDPVGAPWLIVHEQGWFVDSVGKTQLPPGRCTLYTGADFSGWCEDKSEFTLVYDKPAALALEFEPEPRLTLTGARNTASDARPASSAQPYPLENDDAAWIVVEGAGHSRRWPLDEDAVISAPANVPLTIVVQRSQSLRQLSWTAARVTIPSLRTDTDLSWSQFAQWRQMDAWSLPAAYLALEAAPELAPKLCGSFHVPLNSRGESGFTRSSDPHPTLNRQPHAPWELWLRADGYVPRAIACAWNDHTELQASVDANLLACAQVELRGSVARLWGPHGAVERDEDGIATLDELAPGPLTVRVECADGRWLEIALVLAPGETRALALP